MFKTRNYELKMGEDCGNLYIESTVEGERRVKTFIRDDFLLSNEVAKELYHNYAKDLPIIDYHNHLEPKEILEDKQFRNLSEIWLANDHYKWRLMRENGISESLITGESSDYEKFLAWAKTVPNTIGNPLYHWTHIELFRYFQIDELFNEQTAPFVWEKANEMLRSKQMTARSLLKMSNVKFIGTTDDPTDDLISHRELTKEGFDIQLAPSFRPDKGINIDMDSFPEWLTRLEEIVGYPIDTYDQFLQALDSRIEFFHQQGCKSSDHGISIMFYEYTTKQNVSEIFAKFKEGKRLEKKEIDQYKTYTFLFLGERYAEKGWVMQLHLGAQRNNNTRMFKNIGPDSGYDSIGDQLLADPLAKMLDVLEQQGHLPKTILYTLNPRDNYILATMAGNFQEGEIPGKIQFGTAWWFNDHIDGMEEQMKILANTGLIRHFIGMLTDSRSLLSFSRHEYFRRVLCNLLGVWVDQGRAPRDINLLSQYVTDICYFNAKRYFELEV